MYAKIPAIPDDPSTLRGRKLRPQTVVVGPERFFLDGPVSERVAVTDLDAASGRIRAGARWRPPTKGETGDYEADPARPDSPAFIQASAFATVMETLQLFERPDVLGHRVEWAFPGPQLLIVPRAGRWENAFYERESRSLQFFYFDAGRNGPWVYTALSRDIVAHETGHAVLDGLCRAFYDAITPQTMALHESIGDLTALVMALQNRAIRSHIVAQGGSLTSETVVRYLATEFGLGRLGRPFLRDALNQHRLSDVGEEPHDLSQVLTAALYDALVQVHERTLAIERKRQPSLDARKVADLALFKTTNRFARMLFRALDYIPPAEATFADYARAIYAADTVVYPKDVLGRDNLGFLSMIEQGLREREVLVPHESLSTEERVRALPPVTEDLDALLDSDWTAYRFAEEHRALLSIPRGVPFRLLPRRQPSREYYVRGSGKELRKELIFQVTWEERERNPRRPGLPRQRAVFGGTTMVVSYGTEDPARRGTILSLLSSANSSRAQQEARDRAVTSLWEQDLIDVGGADERTPARPLAPLVRARISGDVLQLRGTARLLHLAGRQAASAERG